MKSKKISFLMAAHNEEKIIAHTLSNLMNLPYKNYEVIVGLDGCTDGTEKIVKNLSKKYANLRYEKMNLRGGKPSVINKIIGKADGEIIIINDADWIFKTKNKNGIKNMVEIFNDERVGGIAESFPVQYNPYKKSSSGLLKLGVMWSSFFWMKYIVRNYSEIYNERKKFFVLKKEFEFPLIVNIFRKKLYSKNMSLGDDFERCIDIIHKGYKVVIIEDEKMPRMYSYGEKITFPNLIKQKKRTSIARKQINSKYKNKKKNYGLGIKFYIFSFKEFLKIPIKDKAGFALWIFTFFLGNILNIFSKDKDTKEGWKLRLPR
jgi:cellulose synthase/poly-beta-1,6-N-acetylglucosamine synthase-like glycosyltransferase